jgi:hypothetical protein
VGVRKRLLERLTSFLRGRTAAVQNANSNAGLSSNPTAPLALEWATYQAKKPELLAHEGQWVVIHSVQILGICSSYEEALRLGYERAGYVDFLVHQIRATEPVHFLPPLAV